MIRNFATRVALTGDLDTTPIAPSSADNLHGYAPAASIVDEVWPIERNRKARRRDAALARRARRSR